MKHISYLCLAAALLAGCASKPATWQKAGADDAIRSGDAHACTLQARTAPTPYPQAPVSTYGAPAPLTVDERAQFEQVQFRRCMEEKGYSAQR